MFCILLIAGILSIVYYTKNNEKLHKVALVLIIIFGIISLFLTPIYDVSDETEHFVRSEIVSTGELSTNYVPIPNTTANGYKTIASVTTFFDNAGANVFNTHADDDKYRYTMVGYHLANTVTDNGYVSRGVCETNENGELISVTERTRIEKYNGGVAYTEDDGNTWVQVPDDTTVSMNMWGFTKSILEEIKAGFPAFLDKGLQENPMKCEYFLPTVVSNLLAEDKATVSVLKSADKWYGVTYKEDKPVVVESFAKLIADGVYRKDLFTDLQA